MIVGYLTNCSVVLILRRSCSSNGILPSFTIHYPVILNFGDSFGVKTNHFGFRISWATNASVVVQASTNLTSPTWQPVSTNAISVGVNPETDGWSYFADPEWASNSARFYRLRSQE